MSRNNHEWFKFEFRSWLESRRVQRMSLAAQGLYIRALCVQATQGNIPADLSDFALEAKVKTPDTEAWQECMQHFETESIDGERYLYNLKLRDFLNAAAEKKLKLQNNGAKGGKAPRKTSKPNAKAIASPNAVANAEAKAALRASSSYSLSNSSSNSLNDFNVFWQNYPARRRRDKKSAMAAWDKFVQSPDLAKQIIDHVIDRAATDPDWLKQDGEFVPMPTTFINRARWEDSYKGAPAPADPVIQVPTFEPVDPAEWKEALNRFTDIEPDTEIFQNFLEPLRLLGFAEGKIWILAPSSLVRNWVASKYAADLSSLLSHPVRLVTAAQIGQKEDDMNDD